MKCRRVIPIICLLTIFLTLTTAGASAADSSTFIQEIYSDIESCDITIASSGTVEDLTLEVQLLQKDRIIDEATIPIGTIEANSNIIKFVQWHTTSTPDGAYQINAQIFNEKRYAPQNMSSFTADRSSRTSSLKALSPIQKVSAQ